MKLYSLLTVAFLLSVFPSHALLAQERTLEVGAVLSLTGIASVHGNAIREGLEFAQYDLERTGWKIKIHYEDDATEPRKTVSAVERIANSSVKYFIGPTWGILAIPAAPIFARKKALSLQPCNSSDFVQGVNDRYFFFFTPPSRSEELIVEFLKKHPGEPVAIVNNSSTWGDLWQKIFKSAAAKAGNKVVINESLQFTETDAALPSIASRIKRDKVAVVLSTTTKEATALMIANLEKQRVKATLLSPDLVDSVIEGLSAKVSPYVEGYTVTPIQNKEFIERFTAWKGKGPWKYTDSGYDSLIALAKAVETVGDDTEAVKNYFETKLDMQGAAGRLKFGPTHDVEGSGYEIIKLVERKVP